MFRINRQTDYAIRVVLALARQPAGARLATSVIGEEMLIPRAFLPRVVAQLSRSGLVQAYSGRLGGLQLPRPPATLTLREVVEAMEGSFLLSECRRAEDPCPFEEACPVRSRWDRLQLAILDELAETNFAQLAAETIHIPGPVRVLPVEL